MKSKPSLKLIVLLIILFAFSNACKKDTESSGLKKDKLSGLVQKGPFISGASVDIYELNSSLSQTGKSFSTSIVDNKGYFQIENLELSSRYAFFKVEGYYYNEAFNSNSSSQLELGAIADLSEASSININVLTQLEYKRIINLTKAGLNFSEAKDSAQKEILSIFHFEANTVSNSEKLDITINNEANAMLLAISLIVQGYKTVAEFSEIISNLSSDIGDDGKISDQHLMADLYNTASSLGLSSIRSNLEKRYKELKVNASIPDFEKYIKQFVNNANPVKVEVKVTNTSCFGYNDGKIELSVSGGTPPYSYSWSNNIKTKDIVNLAAGKYSVHITDKNNFIVKKSNIEVKSAPMIVITGIIADELPDTKGSINVEVAGGTKPYSLSWSGGQNTYNITGLSIGTYNLTVTDSNSCSAIKTFSVGGFVKDIDGNIYKTKIVGHNEWMAQNLKTTRYNDGTLISENKFCLSDEGYKKYVEKYGIMYEYTEKLCPIGWHVPDETDWEILFSDLGGEAIAGSKLKDTVGWKEPNVATNESGLRFSPGGCIDGTDWMSTCEDPLHEVGEAGSYWSAKGFDGYPTIKMVFDSPKVFYGSFWTYSHLASVRCVKD